MTYTIETTQGFNLWLQKIKDKKTRYRLDARFDRIIDGQFGDHKAITPHLFELRFFFGGGLRIYYTVRNGQVVLLLAGGNKDSQAKDIQKAAALLEELESYP